MACLIRKFQCFFAIRTARRKRAQQVATAARRTRAAHDMQKNACFSAFFAHRAAGGSARSRVVRLSLALPARRVHAREKVFQRAPQRAKTQCARHLLQSESRGTAAQRARESRTRIARRRRALREPRGQSPALSPRSLRALSALSPHSHRTGAKHTANDTGRSRGPACQGAAAARNHFARQRKITCFSAFCAQHAPPRGTARALTRRRVAATRPACSPCSRARSSRSRDCSRRPRPRPSPGSSSRAARGRSAHSRSGPCPAPAGCCR